MAPRSSPKGPDADSRRGGLVGPLAAMSGRCGGFGGSRTGWPSTNRGLPVTVTDHRQRVDDRAVPAGRGRHPAPGRMEIGPRCPRGYRRSLASNVRSSLEASRGPPSAGCRRIFVIELGHCRVDVVPRVRRPLAELSAFGKQLSAAAAPRRRADLSGGQAIPSLPGIITG